jgi:hypothetical protein
MVKRIEFGDEDPPNKLPALGAALVFIILIFLFGRYLSAHLPI